MVSLVPGTLLKLLKHMKTNTKISDKQRSSLLQIISIVPSLSKEDLFSNNGFFLKVSDSAHATYVSLSSEQNELISSDKIQLGQYIYVQSLQASTPVPIVQGMQLVPGRHPCVGNPEDLASTNFLQNEKISKDKVKISVRKEKSSTVKKVLVTKEKTSIRMEKKEDVTVKRRSLNLKESPVPNKNRCSIPGSVDNFLRNAPEQENTRSMGKPPSISRRELVPTLLKTNTNTVSKGLISSKNLVRNGARKSWDGCLAMKGNDSSKSVSRERKVGAKLEDRATSNVPCRKILKFDKLLAKEEKCIQSSSKKVSSVPSNDNKKELKKTRASISEKATNTSSRLNPDSSVKVSSNKRASIQSPLRKLGKEVMKHRDAARQAAIDAIQEASTADNLLQCLSMYEELNSTASEANPPPTMKKFLKLYATFTMIKPVCTPLDSSAQSEHATPWVDAAISALSVNSKSTHSSCFKNIKQRTTLTTSSSSCQWERGGGAREQAEMARGLKKEAEKWFLKFMGRVLDVDNVARNGSKEVNGMALQLKNVNDWLDGVEKSLMEDVNKDFDDVDVTLETICRIRKKIYKYLLAHVGRG